MTSTPDPSGQSSAPRHGVFLIGFMGSGKTSIGLVVSRMLGWRFEDLDVRIQHRENRTIAQIFSNFGESTFRRIERQALLELLQEMQSSPMVVALGGGTAVQADNLDVLQRSGFPVAFLDATVDELWRRCLPFAGDRPLAKDENQFRQLYEKRHGIYMKAGTRIDTGGKFPEVVASELIARLQLTNAQGEVKSS
ncbi:MAG TPA: shikimate kinase [Terriglobales bacterium]|nr:shikimate kinase [Terriglobales bacterium]